VPEPRFSYDPILGRRRLRLPHDERVAVWVALNVEHFAFDEPIPTVQGTVADPPSPHGYGWYQYGLRVGVFRIMEMLDDHGMRASVPLNSDVCEACPTVVEEGNKRDWVWLAHGTRNRVDPRSFEGVEQERAFVAGMVEAVTRGTGRAPKGWLGPALAESHHTADLLAEHGITYVCDWPADDQPFPLRVASGRMINVPYAVDGLNDVRLRGQMFTGEDYCTLLVDQFDQLYADGAANSRVMCIPIHPHIVGQPFRAKHLRRAIEHIAGHDDVWLTTSDDIAEWYYASAYSAATAEEAL
jgi:peptidoglycan/xylan/chitin deacetylase (PgdA/CDA1 family)